MNSIGPDFEAFLGSAQDRYFGVGYRKTQYHMGDISYGAPAAPAVARASASVEYAPDWSLRDGVARTPHLSTIDALVLAGWMAEAFLHVHGLNSTNICRAWMSEVKVRAGSRPVESLGSVPVELTRAQTAPSLDRTGVQSVLELQVGSMGLLMKLEHAGLGTAPESLVVPAASCRPDVFTRLFQTTQHDCSVTALTSDEIECTIDLSQAVNEGQGLSSAHWPYATLMDGVVLGGQMAETISRSRAISRGDESPQLWMRRMRFQAPFPSADRSRIASAKVVKRGGFQRDGLLFATFEMEADILGVFMSGAFAETSDISRRFLASGG
jgi:hypothetical protein